MIKQSSSLLFQIRKILTLLRRRWAKQSFQKFFEIYFHKVVRHGFSWMHLDLFAILQEKTLKNESAYIAIAAPRSYGKSTIASHAYVIWLVCNNLAHYILIISRTSKQAEDVLFEIRESFENNSLLREDFPEITKGFGKKPSTQRLRADEIVLKNVRIKAIGAEGNIRGTKFRGDRPDVIIVDDYESEEQMWHPEQREKNWDWFTKSILNLGNPDTKVIVLGTVMHEQSMMARLLETPGWIRKKYKALISPPARTDLWDRCLEIFKETAQHRGKTGEVAALAFYKEHQILMDEGAVALWPKYESLFRLMTLRYIMGPASFATEKQNEPLNEKDRFFPDQYIFTYGSNPSAVARLEEELGREFITVGACDPSLGKEYGDPSAIIILRYWPKKKAYRVIHSDIRKRSIGKITDDIAECHKNYAFDYFGYEINLFQGSLMTDLINKCAGMKPPLRIHEIQSRENKMARIHKMQGYFERAELQFLESQTDLLKEVRQYPRSAHDDGLDALEMAIQTALAYKPPLGPPGGGGGGSDDDKGPEDPSDFRWLLRGDYPDADDITGIIG